MNATAGWHTDPRDQHLTRYWNGATWTEERRWIDGAWVPSNAVRATRPAGSSTPVPAIDLALLAKLPVTPIALLGGTALAALGVFLPWEQDTIGSEFLGAAATTVTSGPTKVPVVAFLLIALLGGIAALALPSIRRRLSTVRCVAISALTALLWVMPVLKADALGRADSTAGYLEYHLGLGWYATVLGLLAMSAGCIAGFLGLGARGASGR